MSAEVLDWSALMVPGDMHWCGCEYCDMNGDREPDEWPSLVRVSVNGSLHVTDRYLMVRADLAPVPVDYEGHAFLGDRIEKSGWDEPVSGDVPEGLEFRASISKALDLTGWRLVGLAHAPQASSEAKNRVGVTDEHGILIGWAVGKKATP